MLVFSTLSSPPPSFSPPSFLPPYILHLFFNLVSSLLPLLPCAPCHLFLPRLPILPCCLARWSLGQSKVLVSVSVGSPDLFHVVLRYANRAGSDVRGRVSVIEDGWSYRCGNCKCCADAAFPLPGLLSRLESERMEEERFLLHFFCLFLLPICQRRQMMEGVFVVGGGPLLSLCPLTFSGHRSVSISGI